MDVVKYTTLWTLYAAGLLMSATTQTHTFTTHIHYYTHAHLLDNLRWGVQVDEALVDLHLEAVKGVGAVAAGRLAGCDVQLLGGHAAAAVSQQRFC